ncbi:chorismate mutase [Sphaerisporangium melleum]|uniref:Chorismate mutase n=1 Tax=Sphaerisporangium melleum TaxID=321316 RepID=A0A917R3K9_9ACTN|nr:chorismate mutase [Sphaerisporangium melleum]GGK86489.1 chorismate mutase [Sphaerisporangium melleum]GII71517.1 chorismate mutase [Sphaerisporangium melleum]
MSDPASLAEVRSRIDALDGELVRLLADRQALVRRAAAFKADEQAVRAPGRVEQVVEAARARAAGAGLSPEVAEAVWRAMIAAFIDLELAEHKAGTAEPRPGNRH